MSEHVFRFKNVRGGKPIAERDLPKLPPAALRLILKTLREKGMGPILSPKHPFFTELVTDPAIERLALSLRRIEPTITARIIEEDEDYDQVVLAYQAIQRANPSLF